MGIDPDALEVGELIISISGNLFELIRRHHHRVAIQEENAIYPRAIIPSSGFNVALDVFDWANGELFQEIGHAERATVRATDGRLYEERIRLGRGAKNGLAVKNVRTSAPTHVFFTRV